MKKEEAVFPKSDYMIDDCGNTTSEYQTNIQLNNKLYISDIMIKHFNDSSAVFFGIMRIRLNKSLWLKTIQFIINGPKEKVNLIGNESHADDHYEPEFKELLIHTVKQQIMKFYQKEILKKETEQESQ